MEPNNPSQTTQQAPEIQQPVTQPVSSTPSSKTKYILLSIFILLIIFLVGGGIYYLGVVRQQSNSQKNTQTVVIKSSPVTAKPTSNPTANWKTYTSADLNFRYPSSWSISNNIIQGTNPNIKVSIVDHTSTLMNECMQVSSTETKNGVFVKHYSRVTTGAMCSGGDVALKEIWIIPNKDAYAPGISYSYSVNDEAHALNVFDQIFSTFKFTVQTLQIDATAVADNVFKVRELGIEFQIPADLKDLTYAVTNSNGIISARFSTASLTNLDKTNGGNYCNSANAGLGIISRSSQLRYDFSDSKQIGGFYYIWNHPQATCSDKSIVYQLQSKQSAALGQAFKTLELIK